VVGQKLGEPGNGMGGDPGEDILEPSKMPHRGASRNERVRVVGQAVAEGYNTGKMLGNVLTGATAVLAAAEALPFGMAIKDGKILDVPPGGGHTASRRSEILALRWSDISDDGHVMISRSVTQTNEVLPVATAPLPPKPRCILNQFGDSQMESLTGRPKP